MFSKKEDKGVLLFIFIIATIVGLKNYDNIYQIIQGKSNNSLSEQKQELQTTTLIHYLEESKETRQEPKTHFSADIKHHNTEIAKKSIKAAPFHFNPNTISKDSIILLGISPKIAYNWTKYIQKGGKFHTAKELLKIYGLTKTEFDRIEKYIVIENKIKHKTRESVNSSTSDISKKESPSKTAYNNRKKNMKHNPIVKIELNTCKASDLVVLKGIGQVLSKRIIKFRDKLGGFVSIYQLKDVYGLTPETFDKIKTNITINSSKIKKLKINIEDKDALKEFPYISYRLASQIVKYRVQHGYFSDKKDLLKIMSIDSIKLERIAPYIDFGID